MVFHNLGAIQHGESPWPYLPTTLEAYRWYHLAGAYDGSQVKIYVDGELDGSISHSGELRTRSSWDVGIGSKHG